MQFSNCYDIYFKRSGAEVFADLPDWRWFKAMAVVESSLNPEAVSPAGAVGVMQLMPGTAIDMQDQLGWRRDFDQLLEPHINIHLGILYAKICYGIFEKESGRERIRFMLGGYNAGPGHIISAQEVAQHEGLATDVWASIAAVLEQVTGHHSQETIRYVGKVERVYKKLSGER